jgi:hypothetical protein
LAGIRNSTPHPPAFGLISEGAIGQPSKTTSLCNPRVHQQVEGRWRLVYSACGLVDVLYSMHTNCYSPCRLGHGGNMHAMHTVPCNSHAGRHVGESLFSECSEGTTFIGSIPPMATSKGTSGLFLRVMIDIGGPLS